MYQRIKRLTAFVLVCACLAGLPMEARAATKPINSVSIKISSKLKVG